MNLKRTCKTLLCAAALTTAVSLSVFAYTAKGGTVTAKGALNLRSDASTGSSVVAKLPTGSKVLVTNQTGSWYQVSYGGSTGYVSSSYLKLSDSLSVQAGYAKVTAKSSLHLRSGPSSSSSSLGKLASGATAQILGVENGWVKVSYGSKAGYLSSDYVSVVASGTSGSESTSSSSGVKVTSSGRLNMRKSASTGSSIVTKLNRGTVAKLLSTEGSWYKVSYGSYTGYVSTAYCKLVDYSDASSASGGSGSSSGSSSGASGAAVGQSRSDLVAYAKTLLGCKYKYGGSSTSGFDCSGYTSYVFKQFGYALTRSSSSQYSKCTKISKSQLQPGDLVFFSNGTAGVVGHVGIYIGNNSFIHSENSKTGVCISSMTSSYYSRTYIGSGRVISD